MRQKRLQANLILNVQDRLIHAWIFKANPWSVLNTIEMEKWIILEQNVTLIGLVYLATYFIVHAL